MKYKQIISGGCALMLMIGLTGCGSAPAPAPAETATSAAAVETTAPTVPETTLPLTPDTILAMELVENYLNMEKPQHESIQLWLGLQTAHSNMPVAWFEDYSYTEDGDAALVADYHNVADWDAFTTEEDIYITQQDFFKYPETISWETEGYGYPYDYFLMSQTYYFKNASGETVSGGHPDYGTSPMAAGLPTYYGFSCLPRKSHTAFLRETLDNSNLAVQRLSLSETAVHDMEARQQKYHELKAVERDPGKALDAMEAWQEYPDRPCYEVSYSIPQEYLSILNPRVLDKMFGPAAMTDTFEEESPEEIPISTEEYLAAAYPVKARLSSGTVYVSLYFDKETKQYLGQRLDATDCAGALMDQLSGFETVVPADRSLVVSSQVFDNGFEGLPYFIEAQASDQRTANQAVFSTYIFTEEEEKEQEKLLKTDIPDDFSFISSGNHHHIVAAKHYGLSMNVKTGMYEITDGTDVLATMCRFNGDLSELTEKAAAAETLTSESGLTYELLEIPMGQLFGAEDPAPEEVGYVVVLLEKNENEGICLNVWDRDTAVKIMDDLTFRAEDIS